MKQYLTILLIMSALGLFSQDKKLETIESELEAAINTMENETLREFLKKKNAELKQMDYIALKAHRYLPEGKGDDLTKHYILLKWNYLYILTQMPSYLRDIEERSFEVYFREKIQDMSEFYMDSTDINAAENTYQARKPSLMGGTRIKSLDGFKLFLFSHTKDVKETLARFVEMPRDMDGFKQAFLDKNQSSKSTSENNNINKPIESNDKNVPTTNVNNIKEEITHNSLPQRPLPFTSSPAVTDIDLKKARELLGNIPFDKKKHTDEHFNLYMNLYKMITVQGDTSSIQHFAEESEKRGTLNKGNTKFGEMYDRAKSVIETDKDRFFEYNKILCGNDFEGMKGIIEQTKGRPIEPTFLAFQKLFANELRAKGKAGAKLLLANPEISAAFVTDDPIYKSISEKFEKTKKLMSAYLEGNADKKEFKLFKNNVIQFNQAAKNDYFYYVKMAVNSNEKDSIFLSTPTGNTKNVLSQSHVYHLNIDVRGEYKRDSTYNQKIFEGTRFGFNNQNTNDFSRFSLTNNVASRDTFILLFVSTADVEELRIQPDYDGNYKLLSKAKSSNNILLREGKKNKDCIHGVNPGSDNTEIYYSYSIHGGDWSSPHPLGKKVNTIFAERTPVLYRDSTTNQLMLSFSSEGHAGIGGLDAYKIPVEFKNLQLKPIGKAENILNVNTPDDELNYHIHKGKEMISTNHDYKTGMRGKAFNMGFVKQIIEKENLHHFPGEQDGMLIHIDSLCEKMEKGVWNSTYVVGTIYKIKFDANKMPVDTVPLEGAYIEFNTFDKKEMDTEKSRKLLRTMGNCTTTADGVYSVTIPKGFKYQVNINYKDQSGGDFLSAMFDASCIDGKEAPTVVSADYIINPVGHKNKQAIFFFKSGDDSKDLFINQDKLIATMEKALDTLPSNIRIVVIGYADTVSTQAYNQTLTDKRAATVKDLLLKSRIGTKLNGKISVVSCGETKVFENESQKKPTDYIKFYFPPTVLEEMDNNQPLARLQMNRRVEVFVVPEGVECGCNK